MSITTAQGADLTQPKRLIGPDVLKAVAIFGVVLIHGGGLLHSAGGGGIRGMLQDAGRFAVPSFIVVWAYFYERGFGRSTDRWVFAWSQFKRFFVPFAFWTVLYVGVLWDGSVSFHASTLLTGYWSGFGWPGQYYFIILFQLIALFPVLRRLGSTGATVAVVCGGVALYAVVAGWAWSLKIVFDVSDRLFIYWVPHAVVGVWAAHRAPRAGPRWSSLFALAAAVLVIGLIPIEFAWLRAHGFAFSPYVTPSVLLAGLVLPLLALRSERTGSRGEVMRLVRGVGSRTFGVFCVNPLVVAVLGHLVAATHLEMRYGGVLFDALYALASAVLVLLVSLLVCILIARTPLRPVVLP